MQNDMLKNTIAPWQEKGRWYHGVVDLSTNSFINGKTDSFIIDKLVLRPLSSGHALAPKANDFNTNILDVKKIFKNVTVSTNTPLTPYDAFYTDRSMGKTLYVDSTTGTCEFWVFISQD